MSVTEEEMSNRCGVLLFF